MAFPKVRADDGNIWIIIYTNNGGGDRPIHGAYWSGESWIMAQWDEKGYKISSRKPCALDITQAVASGKISQNFEEKEQKNQQAVQVGIGEAVCQASEPAKTPL